MHQFPDDPDRLNEIVRRLNQEDPSRNGHVPIVNVRPRPSGWKCPKCGMVADQRVDPAPGTILGYRWQEMADVAPDLVGDHRPGPIAVFATEVTEHDDKGNPVKIYRTVHCMNCFNAWQRRKMMEEIRANVPQLEYVGVPDAADN